MLWLALYLPQLAVEIITRAVTHSGALIVCQGQGRERHVAFVNDMAARQGVHARMTVAAACALIPDVHIVSRDLSAEVRMLERLAAWAGQYTSFVSVQPPHALLLEIGGSLQLFGGIQRLRSRVAMDTAALGFAHAMAVAPTPTAAYWLAFARRDAVIGDRRDLTVILGQLPLSHLPWEGVTLDKLHAIGLRYLRDVWRLPRQGLVRRFGAEFLRQLDRARGELADTRDAYQAPSIFTEEIRLPAPTVDSAALQFAANRLLAELAGFLRARGAGVQSFELRLQAARGAPMRVTIASARAHRQSAQWRILVREKLERLRLSEAVETVRLHAARIESLADQSADFFDTRAGGEGEAWLDRVRARLGNEVVTGIDAVAEHRPEYAWRTVAPAMPSATETSKVMSAGGAERPLWLLTEPVRMDVPRLRQRLGTLHTVRGPERIESGWWDNAPIARDYYVVENLAGVRYWVYRDGQGWFLHGVFW